MARGPAWAVRRVAGLLWPGFTKRFSDREHTGVTYLWGAPIGTFDIDELAGGTTELRYHRWPIVDVLEARPTESAAPSIPAAGYVRLPGDRRVRFCRFRLER